MAKWQISLELKGQLPSVKKSIGIVLEAVAHECRREWVKLARHELHSTAYAYIGAIGMPVRKGSTVTIKLSGALPNMLEEGCPPYDMKKSLLRSPKAKTGKGGNKYITVPLYLKTKGSSSPPAMPPSIYKAASKLQFGQSLTLPKKYEGYGLRTRLSPDLKRWGHYTWKTSPFEGIVKIQRWPGLVPLGLPRERQAMYVTFRRVSKKSDPNSWIHPGFRRRNFIERTAAKIDTIFPKVLDSVLSAT